MTTNRNKLKSKKSNIFYLGAAALLLTACQQQENPDWQHLDLESDGVFGISADRAYEELLMDKQPTSVIVAVLDAGFDTTHEDLASVWWVNEHEIPGNGIDDDGNGYIDDIHGWNFAGDADSTYHHDNTELTRLIRRERGLFAGYTVQNVPESLRDAYREYQAHEAKLNEKRQEAKEKLAFAQRMKVTLDRIVAELDLADPSLKDFRKFEPKDALENQIRNRLNASLKRMTYPEFYEEQVNGEIEKQSDAVNYSYNIDFVPHRTVRVVDGDTTLWPGNPDLKGRKPEHGTHISGIIAADRANEVGMRGIAAPAKVMAIRCGYGGIRDEDIARAIRYAVDNGARVINMSFGKEDHTLNKAMVDEAVRYAAERDVLLVQAVGNSDEDIDKKVAHPNPYLLTGDTVRNWLTVAASDRYDDETLKASFSNYGQKRVDVFAPGVRIRSAVPGNGYKRRDGTSMSAPVVAGLAAMIRSYYPELTAPQVKDIIMKSVTKSPRLADRCVSGGVVNAYNAIKLADQYKN